MNSHLTFISVNSILAFQHPRLEKFTPKSYRELFLCFFGTRPRISLKNLGNSGRHWNRIFPTLMNLWNSSFLSEIWLLAPIYCCRIGNWLLRVFKLHIWWHFSWKKQSPWNVFQWQFFLVMISFPSRWTSPLLNFGTAAPKEFSCGAGGSHQINIV